MAALIEIKIGTTLGNMVTITSLGLADPHPTPVHYAERLDLGSGGVLDTGWQQCSWRWAILDPADVNILAAYCPGTTANVYIKTLKRGGGTAVYSAIMIWPQVEPAIEAECYEDFVIHFRELTEAST